MRKDFTKAIDVINIIKQNMIEYTSAICLGGGKLGLEKFVLDPKRSTNYEYSDNGKQWSEELGFAYKKTDLMRCKKVNADIVTAFDVLEHLPKERALKLIELIDCKQLIVFMPINEKLSDIDQKASSNGQLMKHISTWTEDEFLAMGFKTWVSEKYHKLENGGTDAIIAIWTK